MWDECAHRASDLLEMQPYRKLRFKASGVAWPAMQGAESAHHLQALGSPYEAFCGIQAQGRRKGQESGLWIDRLWLESHPEGKKHMTVLQLLTNTSSTKIQFPFIFSSFFLLHCSGSFCVNKMQLP